MKKNPLNTLHNDELSAHAYVHNDAEDSSHYSGGDGVKGNSIRGEIEIVIDKRQITYANNDDACSEELSQIGKKILRQSDGAAYEGSKAKQKRQKEAQERLENALDQPGNTKKNKRLDTKRFYKKSKSRLRNQCKRLHWKSFPSTLVFQTSIYIGHNNKQAILSEVDVPEMALSMRSLLITGLGRDLLFEGKTSRTLSRSPS